MKKLMSAYCERQGVTLDSIRFLFNGQRIQPEQDPSQVCFHSQWILKKRKKKLKNYNSWIWKIMMS